MTPIRSLKKTKERESGNGHGLVTTRRGSTTPDVFGSWFTNLWNNPLTFSPFNLGGRRSPPIDIRDRGDTYDIDAELPGIPKANVNVSVTNDRLEISADAETETEEDEGDYYHREIGRQSFYRSVPLPPDADPDNVEAEMDDGCLCITVGKREGGSTGRRTVRVK